MVRTRGRMYAKAAAKYHRGEREQLQAENEELKQDLLEFGGHSEGCNYPYNEKYGCKCGWLKIYQALKGE